MSRPKLEKVNRTILKPRLVRLSTNERKLPFKRNEVNGYPPLSDNGPNGFSLFKRSLQRNKVEANVYIGGMHSDRANKEVAGTIAECLKCGHKTQSFGVEEGSKKRCLVLLKSECPKKESNFYVEKEKEFTCCECMKSFPVSKWNGDCYEICPGCGKDGIPF